MTKENEWFLRKMIESSEKALSEGKLYTHNEVKEMLKQRRHGNRLVGTGI